MRGVCRGCGLADPVACSSANCHRETHAGLRSFTGDHALGEAAGDHGTELGRPAA